MIGRLLPYEIGDAAWNMAVDQVMLESTQESGQPTLRFYGWNQPTLSLGYFQNLSARDQHPASASAPIVRRSTGGGAILHDRELTYSLAFPVSAAATKKRQELYELIHVVIAQQLRKRGVTATAYRADGRTAGNESEFLCFRRRTDEDLVVSGYKVMGSAQRRTRNAVLQHGSLLLNSSPAAPELPGINDLTGLSLSDEIRGPISDSLGQALQVQWRQQGVTAEEEKEIQAAKAGRFDAKDWLERRA